MLPCLTTSFRPLSNQTFGIFIATSGLILVMALRTYFDYREMDMPTPWSLQFWCKNWSARVILWKFVLLL